VIGKKGLIKFTKLEIPILRLAFCGCSSQSQQTHTVKHKTKILDVQSTDFLLNLVREAGTMALQDGEAKTGFLETKPGSVTFLYS
jgi:hypothetical protein